MNIDSGDPKGIDGRSRRSLVTARMRHRLGSAHRIEMMIVSAQHRVGDHPVACRIAQVGNWLGDGWIYLFLGVALLLANSLRAWLVILTAGVAIGLPMPSIR